jgi:hypothetical protein
MEVCVGPMVGVVNDGSCHFEQSARLYFVRRPSLDPSQPTVVGLPESSVPD